MMSNDNKNDPLYDDAVLTPKNPAALSDDDRTAEEIEKRRELDAEIEAKIFDGVRGSDDKPVQPVRLTEADTFQFRCHKGVSCWNECCHGADVTLTPFDLMKLAEHFAVRPGNIVQDFAVPALHEGSNLPVAKLRMHGADGKGACVFMDEETGCTVYDARPATCRYYPLGLGVVKMKGQTEKSDMFFMVREKHCMGHAEMNEQTVGEYRAEQGVEPYDLLNERWIDILMKMASWRSVGGPGGNDVTKQVKQMFYMVSTDIDAFRSFVFGTRFLETYEIDPDMIEAVRTNDEALLQLGFDWMRNVMFNENTIGMKQDILQASIARARAEEAKGEGS